MMVTDKQHREGVLRARNLSKARAIAAEELEILSLNRSKSSDRRIWISAEQSSRARNLELGGQYDS